MASLQGVRRWPPAAVAGQAPDPGANGASRAAGVLLTWRVIAVAPNGVPIEIGTFASRELAELLAELLPPEGFSVVAVTSRPA